jgi:replicative DNA helicase
MIATSKARRKPLPKNDEEPKPPHSEEAEKGALGSVLRDPQIIPQAQSKVDGASFYNPVNREIWKRAVEFYGCEPDAFDITTFTCYLREQGVLDKVGGHVYITDLHGFVPTATNFEWYADTLAEKKQRRDDISDAQQTISKAQD